MSAVSNVLPQSNNALSLGYYVGMIVGVLWNHHMVFPVYFDGHGIEKWWNSMLVFKVLHRSQSSRTVGTQARCYR